MNGLLEAAGRMGLGSAGASVIAERLMEGARLIRLHAAELSGEAVRQSFALRNICFSLNAPTDDRWADQAQRAYRVRVSRQSGQGGRIADSVFESSQLLIQAGEEMAAELESQAARAREWGAMIDAALLAAGPAFERIEDILDNLPDIPGISLQGSLEGLVNNPLLALAESL